MGRNGLARQNGIGDFSQKGSASAWRRLVTMTSDCRDDVAAILTGLDEWTVTSEWSDCLCCFSQLFVAFIPYKLLTVNTLDCTRLLCVRACNYLYVKCVVTINTSGFGFGNNL